MSKVLSFDDELLGQHLAQAAERLPGPDYYTVLRWIHEMVRPANYLEIGIRKGDSLRLALEDTRCVGIDPEPALDAPLAANTRVFRMTSDEFFATQKLPEVLAADSFSLAFIDGLHLFEYALRDFMNLEKFASPNSIVLLHDCLPLDAVTAERTRTTHFYSGDVWKLTMCLKAHRPELRMKMIRTAPTGLCLVSNLDRRSTSLSVNYSEYLDKFMRLTFEDFRIDAMPPSVGNSREEVAACVSQMLAET